MNVKDGRFLKNLSAKQPNYLAAPGANKAGISRRIGVGANLLNRCDKAIHVDAQVSGKEKVFGQEDERRR